MNKTLIYVLIAVILLAIGVFAWQAMNAPRRDFIEFDPSGPRPSEPLPATIAAPGGGPAAPQPAGGLPMPPGRGGR